MGEVADGLRAVQSAKALKPDLILLDIGLPNLNGIEAASRLAELLPEATVLVVTGRNDPEIVTSPLQRGAVTF